MWTVSLVSSRNARPSEIKRRGFLDRKGGVEVVERTTESASVAAEEGLASYEGVTRVRVKPRVETLAPRSLAHRREDRRQHGVLTRVARPFGAPSIGFSGENLFEPNVGAAGRTPATNPFEYVLRCCAPERALSVPNEGTAARLQRRSTGCCCLTPVWGSTHRPLRVAALGTFLFFHAVLRPRFPLSFALACPVTPRGPPWRFP